MRPKDLLNHFTEGKFETADRGRFLRILSWGGKRREKAGGKAPPAALVAFEALRVKWDQ